MFTNTISRVFLVAGCGLAVLITCVLLNANNAPTTLADSALSHIVGDSVDADYCFRAISCTVLHGNIETGCNYCETTGQVMKCCPEAQQGEHCDYDSAIPNNACEGADWYSGFFNSETSCGGCLGSEFDKMPEKCEGGPGIAPNSSPCAN